MRLSYRKKGVQQVLDAVVDYRPAPTDVPAIKTWTGRHVIGEASASDDEPFFGDGIQGHQRCVWRLERSVRVYSGVLAKGASVQTRHVAA